MAKGIQAPEKELRFTRSGQAVLFWLIGALLSATAVTIFASSFYRDVNPALPHPLWSMVPAILALCVIRLAVRLTRHAYLILTPLGIEIFPFFRPASGMNLVMWQEVADVEINSTITMLTLHYHVEKTSGIHLSLKPIRKQQRILLVKAVIGRVEKNTPQTV